MLLSDLLSAINIINLNASARALLEQDIQIDHICSDDREILPHSLFVCILGLRYDPTKHLDKTRDVDSVVYIVEHIVGEESEVLPQIQVEDARTALAQLAAQFYGHPQDRLSITGITGSNGKTSTSMMVERIHRFVGLKSNLLGTVRYGSGDKQLPAKHTTPEPLVFQKLLAEFSQRGEDHLIMEVSSIGHVQKRDLNLRYDVTALINLSREHLDYHGSMEEYFAAKLGILEQTAEDGLIVLNYGDQYGRLAAQQLKNPAQKIGYLALEAGQSIEEIDQDLVKGVDLLAHNIKLTNESVDFDLYLPRDIVLSRGQHIDAGTTHFTIVNPGYHQILNAMAATAMCFIYGIAPAQAAAALTSFEPIERRFQAIWQGENLQDIPEKYRITVYDDHFANIANIRTTLKSLLGVTYRKLHLIYAIRGMRGEITNRENIETLAEDFAQLHCDLVYATKSVEVVDEDNLVLPVEERVFRETMSKYNLPYVIIDRLDDAIATVLKECHLGDVILLAGCQGMDDGARIFFKQLSAETGLPTAEIMRVIADRVCGWGDESPEMYGLIGRN